MASPSPWVGRGHLALAERRALRRVWWVGVEACAALSRAHTPSSSLGCPFATHFCADGSRVRPVGCRTETPETPLMGGPVCVSGLVRVHVGRHVDCGV